ncbi:hypothetical protein N9N99_02395 [Gammaproteobacteria bacterium]|nr:hypothetical protein [Gammaproteobacteria bacterium]
MKNLYLCIVSSLLVSCSVTEALVIDSDWNASKANKIRWGENNCISIRDNEEFKKLHAFVCPTFKTVVVDSFNSGFTGKNLFPPVGYHKKAADLYLEKNKPLCSIIKVEELVGKYDNDIENDNYGWVFYYEC